MEGAGGGAEREQARGGGSRDPCGGQEARQHPGIPHTVILDLFVFTESMYLCSCNLFSTFNLIRKNYVQG